MNMRCGFPAKVLITLLLALGLATKSHAGLEVIEPGMLAQLGEVAADAVEKNPTASFHHRLAVPVSDELFAKLWDAYPNGEPDDVKSEIGGAVNADWIENTCPIRLSRALNYSGYPISRNEKLHTLRGADKKLYAFRLSEFIGYLKETFGPPTISVTLKPGEDETVLENAVAGHKGIIVFIVKSWDDASGHVDLWDGQDVRHEAHFDLASSVYLWE